MPEPSALIVLGCGYAGSAIARRAAGEGRRVVVTTRRDERRGALAAEGFEVARTPADAADARALVTDGAFVVVCIPPDGVTDSAIAPGLSRAGAITYISTTGVYGESRGRVDDATPVSDAPTSRAAQRLAAEDVYRALGATVLRCPGIYGPDRGLHRRVIAGAHKIPGDGSRALSRIHVEDLASFALASEKVRGETFVVGDAEPAPHGDVVRWICDAYGVPYPPSIPLEEAHETLRGDRRVDASRALDVLGVTLRYPSYRDGMRRAE
ncbi:MAG: NAD(P)-binding domain-containing protein [Polyangiaceae bacterium]